MSRKYIAQTLKRLRLQSGLTADEVGELINKSGKTVNAWENNRGQPDAEILIKLCDIYHVENILNEFQENKPSNILLTEHEKEVIIAYRKLPEMQKAVDRLLEIEGKDGLVYLPSAARSIDNKHAGAIRISKPKLDELRNVESVENEEEL